MTNASIGNRSAECGHSPVKGRVSRWLRDNKVPWKLIANAIGRCERSARAIQSGEREPDYTQLEALAAAFGAGFKAYIYQPLCSEEAIATDQRTIDELRARVARLEARLHEIDRRTGGVVEAEVGGLAFR